MSIKTRCIIGGLLVTGSAFADNCDRTRNTYDDIYCANKVFASADADLNKNYRALMAKLNSSQKNQLKAAQRAWIKSRDLQCSNDDTQTVYVNCNLEQTRERNHWLQERLRECQTVGCKSSALFNR